MPLEASMVRNRSTGAKMRFMPSRADGEAPGGTDGFSDRNLFEFTRNLVVQLHAPVAARPLDFLR
jgi:hypothetical protein